MSMKYSLGGFEIDLSDLEDKDHEKALSDFKDVLVRSGYANKRDDPKIVDEEL